MKSHEKRKNSSQHNYKKSNQKVYRLLYFFCAPGLFAILFALNFSFLLSKFLFFALNVSVFWETVVTHSIFDNNKSRCRFHWFKALYTSGNYTAWTPQINDKENSRFKSPKQFTQHPEKLSCVTLLLVDSFFHIKYQQNGFDSRLRRNNSTSKNHFELRWNRATYWGKKVFFRIK